MNMNNESLPAGQATVLIVDDNPTNISVLYDYLKGTGYRILVAQDGEAALEQAAAGKPDLILLDVMMPGIDGFETCLRLKRSEETRNIPVIFMTALTDTAYIINGFAVGGVDYLIKPLQQEEVHVRVRNHIQMRRLQRTLEEEVAVRRKVEEELRAVNEGKDLFFNIIAHDLTAPMCSAIFFSEYLLTQHRRTPLPTSVELIETAELVHEAFSTVQGLTMDLLSWAQIQMNRIEMKKEAFDLKDVLKQNLKLVHLAAWKKEIVLTHETKESLLVEADRRMLDTVIRNLLANAIKFTPKGGRVRIDADASKDGREITVSITDSGIGIPAEQIPLLFQVGRKEVTYGTEGEKGSGLGLPLCKEMVEKNGGKLTLESTRGKGSTFCFTLPATGPTH